MLLRQVTCWLRSFSCRSCCFSLRPSLVCEWCGGVVCTLAAQSIPAITLAVVPEPWLSSTLTATSDTFLATPYLKKWISGCVSVENQLKILLSIQKMILNIRLAPNSSCNMCAMTISITSSITRKRLSNPSSTLKLWMSHKDTSVNNVRSDASYK